MPVEMYGTRGTLSENTTDVHRDSTHSLIPALRTPVRGGAEIVAAGGAVAFLRAVAVAEVLDCGDEGPCGCGGEGIGEVDREN
jgi:hypothetical protein